MKKLMMLLSMVMGLSSAAHALELEIAPLALQAKAEVLGIQASVDGKRALMLTGEAAKEVAAAAGQVLDASKEMIIVTGKEVDALLQDPIGKTVELGRTIIVSTKELTDKALALVLDTVKAGHATVIDAKGAIDQTVQGVLKAVADAAKNPVVFVTDTGKFVLDTGKHIVGDAINFTCGALKFVGINLGC